MKCHHIKGSNQVLFLFLFLSIAYRLNHMNIYENILILKKNKTQITKNER